MAFIVCDTNFLIKVTNDPLPRVNWKSLVADNELRTLPSVIRELEGLAKSNKAEKTRKRARQTLSLIREGNLAIGILRPSEKEEEAGMNERRGKEEADWALLEYSKTCRGNCLIATMDRSLLSKLDRHGLPYLTLSRGKLVRHLSPGARYLTR